MWVIVQEDPFISLSKAECVDSLVVLNRVSSESIRGFGIRSRSDRQGPMVVNKPVVAGRRPSTGHQAPGLKEPFRPRPPRLDIPGRNMFVPDWTGPLKGYLKGLLRLG